MSSRTSLASSASASSTASSTATPAATPAFSAPGARACASSSGGGLNRTRSQASVDGSGSNSRGNMNGERRRANTLVAPDHKRRLRMANSWEQGGDGDDPSGWSRRRAGTVEGSSGDGHGVMAGTGTGTAGSGSSFATPIDLTSPPPEPRQSNSRAGQWPPLEGNDYMEYIRPRWQPDDEVTECPICQMPFTFWYRKHHCRKCGRVVCASCSPHRITIPRQYIVRPPDADRSVAAFVPRVVDLEGAAGAGAGDSVMSPSVINPALGGGEEVRLCNPCVPDPNPEPPRVFVQPTPPRHRSHQSMSVPRQRSYGAFGESSSRPGRRTVGSNDYPCFGGLFGGSYQERPMRFSGLTQRPLPPVATEGGDARPWLPRDQTRSSRPGRISEHDLCPICNHQFPPLDETGNEGPREAHIRSCIENHGPRVRSPSQADAPATQPQPPALPVRMVAFTATEKDCLGQDSGAQECTICMEEYEVGQPLVRLECLCKFHKRCIVEWFERKKECPVHKS